jgi:hypothetical protein
MRYLLGLLLAIEIFFLQYPHGVLGAVAFATFGGIVIVWVLDIEGIGEDFRGPLIKNWAEGLVATSPFAGGLIAWSMIRFPLALSLKTLVVIAGAAFGSLAAAVVILFSTKYRKPPGDWRKDSFLKVEEP